MNLKRSYELGQMKIVHVDRTEKSCSGKHGQLLNVYMYRQNVNYCSREKGNMIPVL